MERSIHNFNDLQQVLQYVIGIYGQVLNFSAYWLPMDTHHQQQYLIATTRREYDPHRYISPSTFILYDLNTQSKNIFNEINDLQTHMQYETELGLLCSEVNPSLGGKYEYRPSKLVADKGASTNTYTTDLVDEKSGAFSEEFRHTKGLLSCVGTLTKIPLTSGKKNENKCHNKYDISDSFFHPEKSPLTEGK